MSHLFNVIILLSGQSAKGAKIFNAAIAATADTQQNTKEGEEKMKMHMHSYCCLDYAQVNLLII